MSIQRTYTTPAGTLTALYLHNAAKEKNRLDHFSFSKAGDTAQIALSKVWVNGVPASHLKGFKSYVMPEEGVQWVQNHDMYEVTLPGAHFQTLSLIIKISGEKEQTFTLQAPERLTVAGLKKIVSRKLQISDLGSLQIQYQSHSLDANNTLEECGLENGNELTLHILSEQDKKASVPEKITKTALEMFAPLSFVVPDTEKKLSVTRASKTTPVWELIYPGLNLMTICTNKTCQAFRQTAYMPRGMGNEFNMAELSAEATCPACDNSLEKDVNNCGFLDCIYSICGMMADKTKFNVQNKVASRSHLITFEEVVEGTSKISKWKYLKITTKPSF